MHVKFNILAAGGKECAGQHLPSCSPFSVFNNCPHKIVLHTIYINREHLDSKSMLKFCLLMCICINGYVEYAFLRLTYVTVYAKIKYLDADYCGFCSILTINISLQNLKTCSYLPTGYGQTGQFFGRIGDSKLFRIHDLLHIALISVIVVARSHGV